ncbi:hypothetical protein LCGC14_1505610, partial [marine sediment metagenome]
AGQPTKFTSINLAEVTHYAQSGYTDEELARIFDVTRTTIGNWKNSYPEFFDTLKSGKLIADSKVEASLYQRACGYSHPEVHISNYQGKITKTPIIKHYPPDPTSMIFWLKNRQKDKWRDKQELELSGELTIMATITVDDKPLDTGGKKE